MSSQHTAAREIGSQDVEETSAWLVIVFLFFFLGICMICLIFLNVPSSSSGCSFLLVPVSNGSSYSIGKGRNFQRKQKRLFVRHVMANIA